jgi:hypothetical protein
MVRGGNSSSAGQTRHSAGAARTRGVDASPASKPIRRSPQSPARGKASASNIQGGSLGASEFPVGSASEEAEAALAFEEQLQEEYEMHRAAERKEAMRQRALDSGPLHGRHAHQRPSKEKS